MKALNCKIKILLAMFILAGTGLYAQEVEKELHKEFETNKSTVLNIDSKFCELTIKNWDKDQAVFDVTIKTKHSDKTKAKKMLDLITVEFEKNGNDIHVETIIDNKFSKGDFGKNKKFSINIVANVPSYISLDIETKFGSTAIGEISGDMDLEMSFGSMEIEQLHGSETSITVNHGDLSIGKIANAEIGLNFGSIHIQNAESLDVDLNQGELTMVTVNNLIAEVNMGSLIAKMISPSFKIIDIEVNMGNVELGIDENAGFTIEAEMKMGSIDVPKELGKVMKSKNALNSSLSGKYGNGKSMISLEGNLGNIELKLK